VEEDAMMLCDVDELAYAVQKVIDRRIFLHPKAQAVIVSHAFLYLQSHGVLLDRFGLARLFLTYVYTGHLLSDLRMPMENLSVEDLGRALRLFERHFEAMVATPDQQTNSYCLTLADALLSEPDAPYGESLFFGPLVVLGITTGRVLSGMAA
jgi:hypothetical protein